MRIAVRKIGLLLAFASASCCHAQVDDGGYAVTSLRMIEATTRGEALDACQRSGGVATGINWRSQDARVFRPSSVVILCKERVPVARVGPDTAVLQRFAVFDGSECPSGMELLDEPRHKVVVCVGYAKSTHEALEFGDYIQDVTVTSERNYNDESPGWTTVPYDLCSGKPSRHSYQGVFVSLRKRVLPITAIHVLRQVELHHVASSCSGILGPQWRVAGDGGFGYVDTPNPKYKAVLCTEHQRPGSSDPFEILSDAALVDKNELCRDGFQIKQPLTDSNSLCSKWQEPTAPASFIAELDLHRLSQRLVESGKVNAREFLPGDFHLLGLHNINDANHEAEVFVFARRWTRTSIPPPAPFEKPPLAANLHVSFETSRSHEVQIQANSLSFKILQIADLHYTGDPSWPCRDAPFDMPNCTEALMPAWVDELLEEENPDFVAFTGDNVETFHRGKHQAAMDAVVAQVETRKIPYGMIFGNHDDENGFPREELVAMAMNKPFSYTQRGPKEVDGVGNYELNIQSPSDGPWGRKGSTVFRMYFLDSHGYPNRARYPLQSSGYDWVKPNQIEFYRQLSQAHAANNDSVPAIMFFHIPLLEYNDDAPAFTHGEHRESVSSPQVNTNLFSTLVDLGEVKATFVGHDHVNEYCYKRQGIQLCYGGGAGFGQAYGRSDFTRRARVIHWSMDQHGRRKIESWKRHYGDVSRRRSEEVLYDESSSYSTVTRRRIPS